MSEQEYQDQEVVETPEVQDSTPADETDVEKPSYADLEAKNAELEEKNRQLYARTKKAEAKKEESTSNSQGLTKDERDEIVLEARGYDKEDISKLHRIRAVIAAETGETVSLADAANDEMYVAYREKKTAETKRKKAELSASRKSGSDPKQSDISSPGLSREEHKKLWAK